MGSPSEQLPLWRASDGASQASLAAFWLLGLVNNSAYVIMLAGANDISSGSVGVVYLCAVLPALCVKLSAPYWFHRVSYELRFWAVATLMSAAYVTVALSSSRPWQLLGVALSSAQGGLGEASCLALCALYDPQRTLTLWSSGTGFAGVFGYAWVATLHVWAGVSFRHTLLAANASSILWLIIYYSLLDQPQAKGFKGVLGTTAAAEGGVSDVEEAAPLTASSATVVSDRRLSRVTHGRPGASGQQGSSLPLSSSSSSEELAEAGVKAHSVEAMSWRRRLRFTASLWPYTVPLTVVYAAEYSMQSGTWAAIGFPVTSATARHHFYVYANWLYQVGVFVSRSSGMLWQADRQALWLMPGLQCLLLGFFAVVAIYHVPLYNMALLLPAFCVGLLGGAVYVNAFTLISRQIEPGLREFALAAASLGDSAGIAVADIAGILIQGCIFRLNGIPGADFACRG